MRVAGQHEVARPGSQPVALLSIAYYRHDGIGHFARIEADKTSCPTIEDVFFRTATAGRNHRHAASHGFERRDAQALLPRRHDIHVEGAKPLAKRGMIQRRNKLDMITDAEFGNASGKRRIGLSADNQSADFSPVSNEQRQRF